MNTIKLTSIQQTIYRILADKQKYLNEKKNIKELYLGTAYEERIVQYNHITKQQFQETIQQLKTIGLLKGRGQHPIYDYYSVIPLDQAKPFQSMDMKPHDLKTINKAKLDKIASELFHGCENLKDYMYITKYLTGKLSFNKQDLERLSSQSGVTKTHVIEIMKELACEIK